MEERTYCVYQIYNKVEDKSYIGSTYHFEQRIKEHKKDKTGWHIDFNQHPENYEIHILEENINEDNVGSREIYYINLYNAIDNGYNKIRHGNSNSLEACKKLSESLKKTFSDPNFIHCCKGKHLSDDTKQKISKALKGKRTGENNPMYGKNAEDYMTPEAIKLKHQKLSKALKGRKFSEETRNKMSEAKKNISEDTRKKMSEARKGKIPWNKGKTNIYSEETRKKISESIKGKIYINNGVNGKYINPDELQKYIDLGYQRGHKHKKCPAT